MKIKEFYKRFQWAFDTLFLIGICAISCCVTLANLFFGIAIMAMLISYIIGSIPTGYWLTKVLKGIDIRQVGSGSTGATNVYRNVGKAAGISVFVIDFLKGWLPVFLAVAVTPVRGPGPREGCLVYEMVLDPYYLLPVITATGALIGHSRSVFLGFKGGKSAATGLGTLFALDFRVGAFTFITWMIVLYVSKIVSIASILATASCIPLMMFFKPITSYICYCVLGFVYVTIRHKANIGRILAGTEPKIGGKPT